MIPPRLPFQGYKWRWATLTPTEGLNEPPIYLGVLRVLRDNQGVRPSDAAVTAGLARVEREVEGHVETELHLVRDQERNILRNSGQYWKALGLLEDTRGTTGIQLTPFGLGVADGRITRDEFAATVVANLELPNREIQSADEVQQWGRAHLRIRPLRLILEIIIRLGVRLGAEEAYLTPDELIRIVIPLAGDVETEIDDYVACLQPYRDGALDMARWPNSAPESNDRRMAREFLLFLAHYGFCQIVIADGMYRHRFAVQAAAVNEIQAMLDIEVPREHQPMQVIDVLREHGADAFAERRRVMRQILERPQQPQFRRNVLRACRFECLVTRERIPQVLEAAHIIPVEYNGTDAAGNGLCLRSDIHSLFDAGHLRIAPDGHLSFSDALMASPNYRALPPQIHVPRFVRRESLEWRWQYQ